MKHFLLAFLLTVISWTSYCQFADNFTDGDFTNNPSWTGQLSLGESNPLNLWEVTGADLVLKSRLLTGGSGNRRSYLSAPFDAPLALTEKGFTWSFRLQVAFTNPPSPADNNARVYLFSNNANLNESLNGYYIQLREERVTLVRQTGTSTSALTLSGTEVQVTPESWVNVKVTRTETGLWEVFVNDISQGTVTDTNHTVANFIGVQIRFSANTRSNAFSFDDFLVDEIPFDTSVLTIVGVRQIGQGTIAVKFNQPLGTASTQNTNNYQLNNGGGRPTRARVNPDDNTEALLDFARLSNLNYTLTVNGVTNNIGDGVANNLTTTIKFNKNIAPRSIVINEIMADPSPRFGLPDEEYLELMNISDLPIDLGGFVMDGYGNNLSSFVLQPDDYVIITKPAAAFTANRINITSGALTNTGERLRLLDNNGNVIDEVTYATSWYTSGRVGEGYSLERINPYLECTGPGNWRSSTSPQGGTPGLRNAVFDASPDVTPPRITSMTVVDERNIRVQFSEFVKRTDLSNQNFAFIAGPNVSSIATSDILTLNATITFAAPLVSETNYALVVRGLKDCVGNVAADTTLAFYYDVTPPRLEDMVIRSVRRLDLVFSEELRSTTSGVSAFRINDSIAPTSRAINAQQVTLNFPSSFSFVLGREYTLSVTGVEDLTLNRIAAPIITTFTFRQEIDTVITVSANTLDVFFARNVDPTSASNIANYMLNTVGAPQFATYDQATPRKIRLVFANVIPANRSLTMDVTSIFDAGGTRFITPTLTFSYDTSGPTPSAITIIDDNRLLVHFGERIERTSAEIVNNYRLEDNSFPLRATLLADQRTVSLEFAKAFEQEKQKTLNVNRIVDLNGNMMSRAVNLGFVHDTSAPRVLSARLFDPQTVEITYSEAVDDVSALSTTSYLLGSQAPSQVERHVMQANSIRLTFAGAIVAADSAQLAIRNVRDVNGNIMPEPAILFINTLNPILTEAVFLTDTTLLLHFSKRLAASQDADSILITLSQIPIKSFTMNGNRMLVTLSAQAKDQQAYWLDGSGLLGENNVPALDFGIGITFRTFFSTVRVLEDRILELRFSQPITPLTLSQIKFEIPITGIVNQPENPGTIKLFLASSIANNRQYEMSWTGVTDNFGRVIPDFKVSFGRDRQPPRVVSIQSLINNLVLVRYSEKVDPVTALAFNHYTLAQSLAQPVQTAMVGDSAVMLTFGADFIDSTTYSLGFRRIRDLSGNALRDTTIQFFYRAPYTPQPGDLIINEIMANPTPPVGLPNAEYIEIYNTSEHLINLYNVAYSDNLATYLIGNVEIAPGEYLIVCDDSHELLFKPYGKVAVLQTFPALGNDRDSLVLSVKGVVIDRVQYTQSWYRNTSRNSGGYSLERIGLVNECAPSTNWIAAYDSLGGTPGRINSATLQFVDNTPPQVTAMAFVENKFIDLTMSEAVNPPSVRLDSIVFELPFSAISLEPTGNRIRLALQSEMPTGREFTLTVRGFQDCAGNYMVSQSYTLGIGERPAFNQILITEIMANPKAGLGLPTTEYLEIHNTTDRLLTTAGIVLRDNTSAANVPAFNIRPGEYVILCPTTRASEMQAFGRAVGVPNWPSLNIGGERLSLSIFEQVIFTVTYSDTWYKSTEKSAGGYSLEMIDTQNPCGEANNWTASEASIGGTPGQPNSVAQPNPDRFGPKLTQALAINATTARLVFDEKLLPDYPIGEFTFSPTLSVDFVELMQDYKTVDVIFQQPLLVNQKHEVLARGVRDCVGNITGEGTKATFVLPSIANPGEVVINELLFNPYTGGSNFVELYNPTENYYNLRGWKSTSDPSGGTLRDLTTTDLIMEPGDYLVFAPNPAILPRDYPHGNTSSYYSATLPSLPNGGGRIAILRADNVVLDDFTYDDDYHNPLLSSVRGISLERVSVLAPTNDRNNWKSAATDAGYATPGLKNSQSREVAASNRTITISPKVFVPGGINSFTTITYQDDNVGGFASIAVYDINGRAVKSIAQNQLLSANGFFTWDGTNDSGLKVRTGIYVVLVEMYNTAGQVEVLKETVVVGATF